MQERSYTIGEVESRTGLTTHTLRFYEKEGLFPMPVRRDTAGRRVFSDADIAWLRVCVKLRSSGMPLPEMRRYVDLVIAGPGNEGKRLEILQEHEDRVRRQVTDLKEALSVIRHKVALYERHLAAGTANTLWQSGPECS